MFKTFLCAVAAAAVAFAAPSLRAEDHPSKEAVVKFVEEGLEFARKNGKEVFLKEITSGSSFKRGELYFYAYDFNCVCLAHGAKPALVGKDLSDMVDVNGTKVIKELRDQAKTGSGWVVYHWQNPISGKVERKLGYVVKFDDGMWFGSGTYEPDVK